MNNRIVILKLNDNDNNNYETIEFKIDEYPIQSLENKICGREHDSLVYGNDVNEKLSNFLGISVKVIRRKPFNNNNININNNLNNSNNSKNIELNNLNNCKNQSSYSNEGNKGLFLVLNKSSLIDLNKRLGLNDITNIEWLIDRMRPNIVIEGLEEYEEDEIKSIYINNIPFQINSQCSRCTMICINPNTLIQEEEPLRTLYSYRRFGNGVLFGVYASPFTTTNQYSIQLNFNNTNNNE
ncbi:predicted protein [Naegleria gruberi]|uniref:Predicted protein n=1 Tax=Naegleria gruberi TaxID=5762 RepID=D2VXC2_NAEGR|nr:uncharacterized protein NAEGRDRAFT_73694 [Naegleria gruberi]EFC38416.1 predicted protein [Naegleria gruberi]|eukprot:XP_002671160.1 predicted protein [Naegleria gruberi strain NEG-M]